MIAEIPEDEFAAALDACAAEVLWEAGVLEPPVDAFAVAAGLGLVVARDFAMPYRGRFVRLCSEQTPCRAGWHDRRRRRPSGPNASNGPSHTKLAKASPTGCSSGSALHLTNRCRPPASWSPIAWRTALLLPRAGSPPTAATCDWDLLALKERYATASHELIARRMLEMRPPIVITVCDLGRVHWRRSNVTARPPAIAAGRKFRLAASHTLPDCPRWQTLDPESGLQCVSCWPIHEPDWKREILRSEVAEL